ncbi:MAG: hypothetical protein JNM00_02600, partial [Flavobacteriales bacterium]|nr:hypothetical protein [Flavobacteriales bacterium]
MLFVLAIPFVINAQCDQNQVLIDCYHSLGGTVTVRNGSGFIIYQNIINSYTGTDVYSFELSLADGCYT